jgi:hypothetical protein
MKICPTRKSPCVFTILSRSLLLAIFAGWQFFAGSSPAAANPIDINFDSVYAGLSGVDPTAYLATYGFTLSGASPSVPLIYSDQYFYGNNAVAASSGDNFLVQQSAVNGGSYTLNFSTPLLALQFTRIANLSDNLVGSWSATAYSGSTALSTFGESLGLGSFSPAVYSFSGPDITSLTITGNGYGVAGISSLMMDDLIITPANGVPDASSTSSLLGLSLLVIAGCRRNAFRKLVA